MPDDRYRLATDAQKVRETGMGKTQFGVLSIPGPLGYVPMPYDIVVIVVFSALIFLWAYRANLGKVVESKT